MYLKRLRNCGRIHNHQGDVNKASYVAVSELVRLIEELPSPDWNAYGLIASIEEGRLDESSTPNWRPTIVEHGQSCFQ
jgi:hypothetical protein